MNFLILIMEILNLVTKKNSFNPLVLVITEFGRILIKLISELNLREKIAFQAKFLSMYTPEFVESA